MYSCVHPKVLYNHVRVVSLQPTPGEHPLGINDGATGQLGTSASHTQVQVRRERVIEPNQVYALHTHQLRWRRRERHRANQVYALHHTPATGGEEREYIRANHRCIASHHHTSYRWRGGERHRAQSSVRSHHTPIQGKGERVIEQSSVCSHHTPATGGEERET